MRHLKSPIATALLLAIAGMGVWLAAPAYAMSPVLKEMEEGFMKLSDELRPCVVNIDSKNPGEDMQGGSERMNELFKFFGVPSPEGGAPRMPHMRDRMATGSGFIYDKEGHIVTNNHVVEGAEEITVKLSTGKEYPAKVVGNDPDTDLAVIKIEPDGDLPVARLGDSSLLKIGQFAIAVGSPRGFEGSFSYGHVSALGRDQLALPDPNLRFQNFIQTDAAINLGNSGGPLCNLDGEVIGINIAIVYGANSLGFAIPINTAKEIVPQLITNKKVVRGYLGVSITNVKPYMEAVGLSDDKGAFVKNVQGGTPAERAGVKPYDVIRKVNGEPVDSSSDLVGKISRLAPGSDVKLEIWRDKATTELDVKLDEYAGTVREALHGKDVLGLRVQNVTPDVADRLKLKPDTLGVVVSEVEEGSPSEDAGLVPGDVITEVAQKKVSNVDDFQNLVKENAVPGKSLLVGYIRGGTEHDITVIKVPKESDEK